MRRDEEAHCVVIGTHVIICAHHHHALRLLLQLRFRGNRIHVVHVEEFQQRVSLHLLQAIAQRGVGVQREELQKANGESRPPLPLDVVVQLVERGWRGGGLQERRASVLDVQQLVEEPEER